MQSLFGKRGVLLAGLLALAVSALAPSIAEAKPEPGAKARGFRLFARSLGALTVNRVYCGLATTGEVCVDSTNSSTIGGGYWPKGTANQFVFNSGLQLAGIVADTPDNPWGGDTTGAFFFDPKGTTQHGQQVEPIYNSSNPDDVANWPDAALVPLGDEGESNFNQLLRSRVSASQGDVWWLSWEGNPAQNAGRSHPLGLVVETRGMGWNFPAGNEDIVYFIYTFYNVTSLNPADYAAIRPGLRETMIARGQEFHSLNNAAFGISLPQGGYTIEKLFAAFGADMDVSGDAGNNYSSVVLPFAMGHTYLADFHKPGEFTFDPGIFGPPFFESAGFVGVKYLKSPAGAGAIQLFSNTINGGAFGDAQNTKQLFRYLSGTLSPAQGDQPCNTGDPTVTHMCYVNNGDPADMRFFQSSTPLTLAPGQFGSIVVAYIFAAPYQPASYQPGNDVRPEQPYRMASVDSLTDPSVGANMIDSIAGLLSYADGNGDNIPQQSEFTVATGSLLGKANVAQAVFDSRFLLPFAPETPEFFLVPGDDQVTVLWRPSASESTGDPFFAIAKDPTALVDGAPSPNPLYDPNYRQFDVEGYRVYRGRVDAPNALSLIAQFDYSGTEILDFSGTVNPIPGCAPELGVFDGCPVGYLPEEFAPGVLRTVSNPVPLVGQLVQITSPGSRVALAAGALDTLIVSIDTLVVGDPDAEPPVEMVTDTTFGEVILLPVSSIILAADTAVTGSASGFPQLSDTDVPFVYVDQAVRNNFRYFYSVTAFDLNSFQSGPSNLESPRITKAVTPVVTGSNAASDIAVTATFLGRGQTLDPEAPVPSLDAATLTFSGPFPPADAWEIGFVGAVSEVLSGSGNFSVKLDSIALGSAWDGTPNLYHLTATSSAGVNRIAVPITQNFLEPSESAASTPFPAASVDPGTGGRFGGSGDFALYGQVEMTLPGMYLTFGGNGRASAFGPQSAGFPAQHVENGPRWFTGANETAPHPNAGFLEVPGTDLALFSNAGTLPGVSVIHSPVAYLQGYSGTGFRTFNGVFGGALRAADLQVYWGEAGAVDSVIDITHNVVVPFDTAFGGGWGLLTPASATNAASVDGNTGVVTFADFACVWPAPLAGNTFTCGDAGLTQPYRLVTTATIAPIQIRTSAAGIDDVPAPGQQGFGIAMPGAAFLMATDAVPTDGTVWTLRSYTGAITDEGAFSEAPRTLSAIGTEIQLAYTATNEVLAATEVDLAAVHTVPDPYYVTSEFEQTSDNKVIKFVNLPTTATIRIYSSSGVLVDAIEHNTVQNGGTATWDVRNRNNQVVASGVYFYHIESGDARRVGRFTIVNFAQ